MLWASRLHGDCVAQRGSCVAIAREERGPIDHLLGPTTHITSSCFCWTARGASFFVIIVGKPCQVVRSRVGVVSGDHRKRHSQRVWLDDWCVCVIVINAFLLCEALNYPSCLEACGVAISVWLRLEYPAGFDDCDVCGDF